MKTLNQVVESLNQGLTKGEIAINQLQSSIDIIRECVLAPNAKH